MRETPIGKEQELGLVVREDGRHDLVFNNCCIVAPSYINGTRIIHEDVTTLWNEPLRKWNRSKEVLAFIHIGKAGGTSLDNALQKAVLPAAKCNVGWVSKIKNLRKRNRELSKGKSYYLRQAF